MSITAHLASTLSIALANNTKVDPQTRIINDHGELFIEHKQTQVRINFVYSTVNFDSYRFTSDLFLYVTEVLTNEVNGEFQDSRFPVDTKKERDQFLKYIIDTTTENYIDELPEWKYIMNDVQLRMAQGKITHTTERIQRKKTIYLTKVLYSDDDQMEVSQ